MSNGKKKDEQNKPLLGEILVARKIITEDQLKEALKVQKDEHDYIGEILIRLGFLEERDVVVALVVQCNLPYIAIDKYEIDQSVIQLIPEEVARNFQVVPLDRVGDVLSVVMANPLNKTIQDELQRMTNCKIAPFIATKIEIQKAIEQWYGKAN